MALTPSRTHSAHTKDLPGCYSPILVPIRDSHLLCSYLILNESSSKGLFIEKVRFQWENNKLISAREKSL